MNGDEQKEGLRSMQVMTRNLPTIQLEEVLVKAGYEVEYSGGLMLITNPNQPKRETRECGCMHENHRFRLPCPDCGVPSTPAPEGEKCAAQWVPHENCGDPDCICHTRFGKPTPAEDEVTSSKLSNEVEKKIIEIIQFEATRTGWYGATLNQKLEELVSIARRMK